MQFGCVPEKTMEFEFKTLVWTLPLLSLHRPISTSAAGRDVLQAQWVWKWSCEQVQLPPAMDLPDPVA